MRRLAPMTVAMAGALAMALAGCGGANSGSGTDDGKAELSVSSAYMPQPISDDMAAGFFTVANKGGTADELTSVTSDVAGEVTMHVTTGGMMEQVNRLEVPAHGRLVFRSGGTHLMFEKLKHKPTQGQTVSVELHFAHSGPVVVEMPVKSATYNPKTGH